MTSDVLNSLAAIVAEIFTQSDLSSPLSKLKAMCKGQGKACPNDELQWPPEILDWRLGGPLKVDWEKRYKFVY